jgi:predicted enzyme related to lactoylglutathione lyase
MQVRWVRGEARLTCETTRKWQAETMTTTVLFAGVPVADYSAAVEWYSTLLGRSPDIPVHSEEVMWKIAEGGWLYVLAYARRAGNALATICVADLDQTMAEITARGIASEPIEPVGDAGRKAWVEDNDGNRIAFIEVTAPSTTRISA